MMPAYLADLCTCVLSCQLCTLVFITENKPISLLLLLLLLLLLKMTRKLSQIQMSELKEITKMKVVQLHE